MIQLPEAGIPPFLREPDISCRGKDPEMFHSEERGKVRREADAKAKRVCRHCPVQAVCLEWATRTRQEGVWGGATARERRRSS